MSPLKVLRKKKKDSWTRTYQRNFSKPQEGFNMGFLSLAIHFSTPGLILVLHLHLWTHHGRKHSLKCPHRVQGKPSISYTPLIFTDMFLTRGFFVPFYLSETNQIWRLARKAYPLQSVLLKPQKQACMWADLHAVWVQNRSDISRKIRQKTIARGLCFRWVMSRG